ncbi:hypothetical protein AQJ91_28820 [Streptomyces dysideae]|uniref:ABC transporter domain-containing protein n=1 Tax=Streptomyces dysideae TaxID=909626 RepID=A0A101UVN6_9ACTN|nr:ABC transporter ATP-binding protein [Streptomyces dysideae]KUO17716.1 hypothetical protein AQJ91_28820 [Streptomyces dysideae]
MALSPDLRGRENLRFFGRLYRLPRRPLERRVDEVLELIDLTARAGDRVDSLSGGMRRRLNIGAGLVHSPTLLVLDEPTVGVDPQSRHAILESVTRFGEEGMAILYTTHHTEEAERLCDHVGRRSCLTWPCFAAVLLTLASVLLRRRLTGGPGM